MAGAIYGNVTINGRVAAPSPQEQLDAAVAALTAAARLQWTRELAIRDSLYVSPMRLTWSAATPAGRAVGAHPAVVLGDASLAGSVSYLRVSGDVTEFGELWRRLPRRQLVILGEPGSGKTTAVLRCTLDLLSAAAAGSGQEQFQGPAPVLLALGSWNPTTQSPLDWMIERISAEYNFLRDADAYGADVIGRLLAHDRILPVLDGLDEMPPAWRALALPALDAMLNAGSHLILTCRREEYLTTVAAAGRVLAAAAVVELLPAAAATVTGFLAAGAPASDDRWRDFTTHVANQPGHVPTALSNPLMASLARTVYTDRRTRPAELFDATRFPDQAAVERHLLGALIPAVYADRGRPYDPVRARRWLSFLARHLHRSGTYDLRWWELHRAPRFVELWLLLSVAVAACTTVFWAVAFAASVEVGPPANVDPVTASSPTFRPQTQTPLGDLRWVLVSILVITLLALLATDGVRRPRVPLPDSGIRSLVRQLLIAVGWAMLLTVPLAVTASLLVLMLFVAPSDLTAVIQVLAVATAATLSAAVPVGLLVGLIRWLRLPDRSAGPASVQSSVAGGRRAGIAGVIVIFLISGPIPFALIGVAVALVFSMTDDSMTTGGFVAVMFVAVVVGLAISLLITPMTIAVSRWFRFRLVAAYYALWGRLPWRLLRFLNDAHRRGILRQVGPVYQFRHAYLQDHLARDR
ncbi:NACHT domain-containing protein [Dactylosporangium siamense]|uniref:NACHT domain-containing protein n=1 Tax=Dactylosporangium siamense TaxID=685454 RepID=A0A919PQU0_9ACTN|nr:hypothetical protein [Dactylosporangium siamense]GIG48464.1 hypothetical protein Dsi01nite_065050 [Dactylosporangium siamense]